MTPHEPLSLSRKLLADHLLAGELRAGADIRLAVDQVLLEDATGTMAAMQFEMLGADSIGVPLAVVYIDHNVLQIDDKNMQDARYLQTFAARYGLRYSPPGHGISHYIHLEHFARPGTVLVGADSHTSMAGAVGSLAIGAGGLDVAVAMAGYGFDLVCPTVVGVELAGSLPAHASAKDVVLELLRRYDVRGGRGRVFEFYGEGVATLSTTARATICNMIVETGATTAIFPSDERTADWLTGQGRADDHRPLAADPGAGYDESLTIDLATIGALVALPHSPGNVHAAADLEAIDIVQVCVGSSVNSSYDDLATVAAILRGSQVHPSVQLTVTPGSRQILQAIIASGVYEELLTAGARMLEPICGPCVGIGQAPIKGAPSLRTFNRNFPGRSGTAEDAVFLCSPATAAASALAGRIVDPATVVIPPIRPASAAVPALHDEIITHALPADTRVGLEIERGPNLVAPPAPAPLAGTLSGEVLIVVGDDISTGDMAPDGAIAMSVWSNIEACARFMFQRLDPDFFDRARAAGGGFIVGGENYGQGSSREHAALIPLFLRVPAVVAKSYARIHRRNLINVGVVPLVLAPGQADVEVGVRWTIRDLRAAVASGSRAALAEADDGSTVELVIDLTPAERETVVAGGLLAQVRSGSRRPAPVLTTR
ncbi:aconitate hydratase [Herbiconiux sp. KACC 21604]|uniref:aconitate hydratase n=1 Tax=unclassified Herbiconiux TaxID=2618217 RepID=UPI001492EA26|nr:aconitate hydratase [Herbiconiux sp. SALV-R1]QJU55319.1 aconitate hydratase [Herbiconiux sp. SALV-R1]WPO86487.1 aconitate hydratase [Herbiconiux sp. KACC 21604]